ncbi:hypothetical protein KAX02_09090 [candidate division WOR-3 bacterium]|nr:hypothetical protein [candidate division WOR-3 bacterium]
MKNNKETWVAILLGIVLLLSIFNEIVGGIKNSNFEKQIEQDLDLSKSYGETNARWLEVNEMLQRNIALALEGLWKKTVEESGKFKKETFTEEEWIICKDKTVGELWEYNYNNAWKNLRKSINKTNEKRHKQEDFIIKNKSFNVVESILKTLQTLLVILSLILYIKIIKDSKNIDLASKNSAE